VESGVKDEKPLALRTWSLNGGVIRIQLTRLADFADGDAIHGAIHAFTKALAGSRAPSDAALVEALDACKVKFAEYALLHYRKRTPDGDEKAMANQRMADMCDAALAAAKGQQP